MKILITGIGGSGKTTLVEALSRKGNIGVDLDKTGLCFWVNKITGEKSKYTAGAGPAWIENHSWKLNVDGLKKRLGEFSSEVNIYVGGKIASSQIKDVFPLFDKVFLLRPSDDVLAHRQSTRTNKENKFAKSKDEQEHLRVGRIKFEEECLKNGAIIIDADKSVAEITNIVNS